MNFIATLIHIQKIRNLCLYSCIALFGLLSLPALATAALIYSDDFNTNTSANYNTYITAGTSGPSGDVTFGYDYGAAPGSGGLGITTLAPNTTDSSTLGLRLRTDNLQSSSGTVVGATQIVTKALNLPASYKVQVDVWSNYIGGTSIASSGSNGTTGVTLGVGTSGNSLQYVAANDGLLVEGFGDNGGGANQAYRVYTDNVHPNPTTKGYWAAGTSSTSASFSDPYYTSAFPSVSAPSAQSTFSSTQSGSTAAGTLGFAWHTWTITNDTQNVVWAIDGKTIATIPTADFTAAGSQVSLGNDDTGLTGNSSANNQLFNAEIFDNFQISDFPAIPEPTSATLFSLAGLMLAAIGRRRSK